MYNIGVDIGGTSVKIGIVDKDINIIDKTSISTNAGRNRDEILSSIKDAIDIILKVNNISIDSINHIGFGIPGTIDTNKGIIVFAKNFIDFNNVEIVKYFKSCYSKSVITVENDANSAVFGEYLKGVSKGYKNILGLTLGTGIGAGLIINSKIYRGKTNGALEIGHMILHSNGTKCKCTRLGCFQEYVSATALVKRYLWQTKNTVNESDTNISCEDIFNLFSEEDRYATKVIYEFLENLSLGLANLIYLYDSDIITIGGGVSVGISNHELLPIIIKRVSDLISPCKAFVTEIKLATTLNDAGIIGSSQIKE